jgi:hypothetical protein
MDFGMESQDSAENPLNHGYFGFDAPCAKFQLNKSHQSRERLDIPTHLPTVARISCSTIIESYLRNEDRRNRNSQVNQTVETVTAWDSFALRRSRGNNFKRDSSFSSITWKDYKNIACKSSRASTEVHEATSTQDAQRFPTSRN